MVKRGGGEKTRTVGALGEILYALFELKVGIAVIAAINLRLGATFRSNNSYLSQVCQRLGDSLDT